MKINIQINPALSILQKKFGDMPDNIQNKLAVAIKKSALDIEGEAKKVTPVDTGRLRASIFTTINPMSAIVEPKTNYAIFVHEGTNKMQARPYMLEGARAAESRIAKYFTEAIKEAIK